LADALRASLTHIYRRIRQDSGNDPSGLSMQQKMLLEAINMRPGVGVAELARMGNVRSPTMSEHVKTLEKAGLVRRSVPDSEDRRRTGLELTEYGATQLERMRGRRDWLALKLAQLPVDGTMVLRQAIAYLHELGE
jgi:DNA-binding MarR family transcriptional regulator